MSSVTVKIDPRADKVWFDDVSIHINLEDGRDVSAPLEWYPSLRDATKEQREKYRLIGKGIGIDWKEIDEDLSVAGFLQT